ncbi:MAG: DNA primase [Phycisphaerales bacterium]|nr:DNA primase [Phycisphaerales bacterium]
MSASRTGNDFKASVLQATDIVELIGQTVALKRRGKDYVGLCPFHQEKTPSFHVSPSKQFFHCYGCKAGGNAIDFVMRRDRIEFMDAMRLLGERAGIEMPRFGGSNEKFSQRQVLLDAQSAAGVFFEKLLSHPTQGKAARQYLQQRGFNEESIRRFQIGLAPDAWDGLLTSAVARKFSPEILVQAGLVKPRERDGGFYDTFRNRLMFPIRDESGRIIAFGGRVMPGSQDPAKYLNSPETPLFSKSRTLYGLDLARQRAVEKRTLVVVEGYTDVIMSHQFGVSNVVSALGTALTEQHVGILRRFADRIVLLFDADSAGDMAANRAVELFLTQPVEILIASMPAGVDPDEFLMTQGASEYEQIFDKAQDALSYTWRQLQQKLAGDGTLTSQQKAVEEYLAMLAAARGSGPVDSLRWGAILARVSRQTDIPMEELNRRFGRGGSHGRRKPQVFQNTQTTVSDSYSPGVLSARDRAERWVLGVLLAKPERWHDVQQHLNVQDFNDPVRQQLAEIYWHHQRDEGEPVFSEFLGTLDSAELSALAVELINETEQWSDLDRLLTDAVDHLLSEQDRQERRKLVASLRRTTDATSPTAQSEVDLLKSLQEKARQGDLRRA